MCAETKRLILVVIPAAARVSLIVQPGLKVSEIDVPEAMRKHKWWLSRSLGSPRNKADWSTMSFTSWFASEVLWSCSAEVHCRL